ncbi:MAG: glycosyltransferase [Candidatus Anaerobiospirillum pullicola]|uniref:Glycosyltransferase n=1 Tax=Candidatus Anaerobiospirillum pullicola TaxID=2838451 RepID=A0A948TGB9_9GAMM|nr:glycosyltransferase [Candidatus Anaerobiospirillum pullicola]
MSLKAVSSSAAIFSQDSSSPVAGHDVADNSWPLISIVMPVCNTGVYMVNAVKSIVAQSYPQLELLLVDDASSDELTLKLLYAYERAGVLSRDNIASVTANLGGPSLASNEDSIPEIKALHSALQQIGSDGASATQVLVKVIRFKEDLGVGAMRNEGVKAARGDYIVFADSDDLLAPQCVSRAYEAIKTSGAEVVCFASHNFSYDQHTNLGREAVKCTLPENTLISCDQLINAGDFVRVADVAWGKIFARHIYLERNITFEPHVIFEDCDWVIRLLLNTNSIFYLPFDGYWRVLRPNSITSQETYTEKIRDSLLSFGRIISAFEKSPYLTEVRPVLMKQAVASCQKACERANVQNNKRLCLDVFQGFVKLLAKLGLEVSTQPSFAYDWWHHILYKLPAKSEQARLEHFVKTRMARLYRRYCK